MDNNLSANNESSVNQINYKNIVEGIDGLVFIYSENKEIQYVNNRLNEMLSYSPIGKSLDQLLEALNIKCESCDLNFKKLESLKKLKCYNEKRKKWYQGNVIPIKNVDHSESYMVILNEIDNFYSIVKDFSEPQSQNVLLLESLYDGVLILDKDYVIRYANKKFIEESGYSKEELQGISLSAIQSETSRKVFLANIDRILSKDTRPYESVGKTKEGIHKAFIVSPRLIMDEQENICGFILVYTDITILKQTEKQLNEFKEELQAVYDGMTDGLIIATEKDKKVLEANMAFCNMLGYTREEVINMPVTKFHPENTVEKMTQKLITEGIYEHRVILENIPTLKKDDTLFYTDVAFSFIYYKGEPCAIVFFRDISHRKKIEDDLNISQQFQKALLDNIPDLAWLKDVNSKYILVNKALSKSFGLNVDDFTGKTDYDLSPPELAEKYVKDDQEVIKTGKIIKVEERWVNKDKEEHIIETIKTPIYNDEGEIVAISGIARNITERKKIEEVLKQSQLQLKAILDNIPDIAWLKDENCQFVAVNEALAKGYGYDTQYFIGKSDFDFSYPELAEHYQGIDKKVLETGKKITVEETWIDKNKQHYTIETIKSPVYNDKGEIVGTVGIARDITERKIFEKEIQDLRKRLEFILGATKTGLDILDSELNVIYVDPEWTKVYGDYTNKKCHDYFMGSQSICKGCGAVKALETKSIVVSEEYLPRENNRFIQVTSMPFQDENGEWYIAEVNVDITERKKMEEELNNTNKTLAEKTQRLEELNNLKNEFLGMAAHDIRNPLNTISNLSTFLMVFQHESLNEEQLSMLQIIKETSQKLLSIVNNLLDVAAIEAGKININKSKTNLKDLINSNQTLSVLTKQKDIEIKIEYDDALPLVEVDENLIGQVFDNLISNAVKFSNPNTTILIKMLESKGFIDISITDQGIGIPKEDMNTLFKPFQKRIRKVEEGHSSTGLGLAIVKKIVDLHNGKITVESKLNQGSTFTISLPLYEKT